MVVVVVVVVIVIVVVVVVVIIVVVLVHQFYTGNRPFQGSARSLTGEMLLMVVLSESTRPPFSYSLV